LLAELILLIRRFAVSRKIILLDYQTIDGLSTIGIAILTVTIIRGLTFLKITVKKYN